MALSAEEADAYEFDITEFLATYKSITAFVGLGVVSSPVATTDTLALPSKLSSKIDPTITSASG